MDKELENAVTYGIHASDLKEKLFEVITHKPYEFGSRSGVSTQHNTASSKPMGFSHGRHPTNKPPAIPDFFLMEQIEIHLRIILSTQPMWFVRPLQQVPNLVLAAKPELGMTYLSNLYLLYAYMHIWVHPEEILSLGFLVSI